MSRMRHSRRLRGIQSARYFAAARSRVPAKDAELAGHPAFAARASYRTPPLLAGAEPPGPLAHQTASTSLEGITVMQSRWNASMMESGIP